MASKAVVLAAGRGDRLQQRTNGYPKCLVPVLERPLIDRVLTSLAKAGVRDVLLVLGFQGEQIKAHLGSGGQFGISLTYVWNLEYHLGNASSLSRALPIVTGEPFVLAMADHLCSATMMRTFLAGTRGRLAIGVDRSDLGPIRTAEATKVALEDGFVVDIGKQLARWDGVDVGLSYWPAGSLDITGVMLQGELAALMARLARTSSGLAACDVSGQFWLDIDTEDDLCQAEALLRTDAARLT